MFPPLVCFRYNLLHHYTTAARGGQALYPSSARSQSTTPQRNSSAPSSPSSCPGDGFAARDRKRRTPPGPARRIRPECAGKQHAGRGQQRRQRFPALFFHNKTASRHLVFPVCPAGGVVIPSRSKMYPQSAGRASSQRFLRAPRRKTARKPSDRSRSSASRSPHFPQGTP